MGARGEERAARSIFRFERARTGLENFGCERGLGLSTHWQWSVMVTGGRASEQSSNRATEHNQFIHPMHGSVLHPALSRVRYVLARILHVLAICTTSFFCESQLAEPRLPHDYTISSLLLLPSEENFSSSDNNDIFFGAEPRGGGKEWKVAPRANGRGGIRRRNGKASSS